MAEFDVVVIGAGPGGYIAAIRAAQLGLAVACVDDFKNADGKSALGGTCLNVGCIPSKALLESSALYEAAQLDMEVHGIEIQGVKCDLAKMIGRKDKIVSDFTMGITHLFKKNKVTSVSGRARLSGRSQEEWQIDIDSGKRKLTAKHVIIATGSRPRELSIAPVDGKRIVDNVEALSFSEVPRRLGIIGAGVIGLELGSVWRRLGSEVTLVEAAKVFMPAADEAIAKEALRSFTKQGLKIHLGAQIDSVSFNDKGLMMTWRDPLKKVQTLELDKLIVAVGRIPNANQVADQSIGLKLDQGGGIAIDEYCQTNLPNVYAVGDVVHGPMLAHKASEEGVMVSERIAGQQSSINHNLVPWVVYTAPEIAWVGKNEQELKALGTPYRSGQFSFQANGRARCLNQASGLVKILADAQSDRVLGMHIIGPMASELIQQGVLAMAFSASSEDVARIVHAHPSLSEVIHEASLAVDKRALHH
ncbi:MAG: dihydrolipoyl dehydrogenase [Nitrospirae bacterium]|nr:dihydrolipoyl dehydrogenase [Nitrospirota bacterium]